MRKHSLRILLALIGAAGLGMAAKGQAVDQIVVNIPYEFVVNGKTLPPGTYRVNRLSDTDPTALVLSIFEKGASAMLLSTTQVGRSSVDKLQS